MAPGRRLRQKRFVLDGRQDRDIVNPAWRTDESTARPTEPRCMSDTGPSPAGKPKPAPAPLMTPLTRFRSLSDPESLREFAKNLREGIYITTRDGRLLDCNAAFLEMIGVRTAEELGEYGASSLFVDIQQ